MSVRPLSRVRRGELVAFARRANDAWYIAVLNCTDESQQLQVDTTFLAEGTYQAELIGDAEFGPTSFLIEAGLKIESGDPLSLRMQPGGGFFAKINKPTQYTE